MSQPKKSDKALIKFGQYECIINKYGGIVNAPYIEVWSEQNIRDYIGFLENLLLFRKDEHAHTA